MSFSVVVGGRVYYDVFEANVFCQISGSKLNKN